MISKALSKKEKTMDELDFIKLNTHKSAKKTDEKTNHRLEKY